jgi:hypothetical protein
MTEARNRCDRLVDLRDKSNVSHPLKGSQLVVSGSNRARLWLEASYFGSDRHGVMSRTSCSARSIGSALLFRATSISAARRELVCGAGQSEERTSKANSSKPSGTSQRFALEYYRRRMPVGIVLGFKRNGFCLTGHAGAEDNNPVISRNDDDVLVARTFLHASREACFPGVPTFVVSLLEAFFLLQFLLRSRKRTRGLCR